MNVSIKGKHSNIAVIKDSEVLITDAQTAIDLAMTISHDTGAYSFVLPKICITEDFFTLSTGLAGEVLQKYINYGMKLAVVGDFSVYDSKPLHDFIYESNKGKDFFFAATEADAIEKLEYAASLNHKK